MLHERSRVRSRELAKEAFLLSKSSQPIKFEHGTYRSHVTWEVCMTKKRRNFPGNTGCRDARALLRKVFLDSGDDLWVILSLMIHYRNLNTIRVLIIRKHNRLSTTKIARSWLWINLIDKCGLTRPNYDSITQSFHVRF